MNFKTLSIFVAAIINLSITGLCNQNNEIENTTEYMYKQNNSDPLYWTLIDEKTNYSFRSKRTASRETKCNISKFFLDGLKSEIKETVKSITNINDTCISKLDASHCDYILWLLQCGFNQILGAFNNPEEYSLSESEYEVLKNASYNLNKTANTFKDKAGKNEIQLLKKIDNLIALNTQLNHDKTELFTQQTILICASEIYSGRIESALAKYNKIRDPKFENFNKIIEKSSTYAKADELVLDRMIEFIKQLPLSHMFIGIEKMFTVFESSDSTYGESIFLTVCNLTENKKTIIQNWKSEIRSSSLKQILEYSEVYNNLLKKIIADIFLNRLAAEEILRFVADLPDPAQRMIGYEILLQISTWVQRVIAPQLKILLLLPLLLILMPFANISTISQFPITTKKAKVM